MSGRNSPSLGGEEWMAVAVAAERPEVLAPRRIGVGNLSA
jgi:hypothetical protein